MYKDLPGRKEERVSTTIEMCKHVRVLQEASTESRDVRIYYKRKEVRRNVSLVQEVRTDDEMGGNEKVSTKICLQVSTNDEIICWYKHFSEG